MQTALVTLVTSILLAAHLRFAGYVCLTLHNVMYNVHSSGPLHHYRGMFQMGFHEKSALACFISISCVYVPYFVVAFRYPMAALGLIWVSAIGLSILLTAFHIVNAIATRSIRSTGNVPPVDELDRKIELSAAKWAGFILACVVVTWILVVMYAIPVMSGAALAPTNATAGEVTSSPAIPMLAAMWAVHWLFAGFVFSNIAYYGGIVFGYRRIASA